MPSLSINNNLSISVDMGAKNNGIFIVKSDNTRILSKKASCITIDGKTINFSKKDRRENRHKDRNYKRRKLAKRLLNELIDISKYSPKEQELINGLFNNRGYTFLSVSSEFEEIQEDTNEFMKLNIKDIYNLVTKNDFEKKLDVFDDENKLLVFLGKAINDITVILKNLQIFNKKKDILKDIDSLQNKQLIKINAFSIYVKDLIYRYKIKYNYTNKDGETKEEYLSTSNQSDMLKKIQENYNLISLIDFKKEIENINSIIFDDKTKENIKTIQTDLKLLKGFLLSINNEIETGSKPRAKYLQDIQKEIENNFYFIKNKTHFFNLVGNISNLQLRVLRKMFNHNSKHKSRYNILRRYFTAFHYKKDTEKDTKTKLFTTMLEFDNLKKFLENCNPIYTIPPYEDMNNRDTYKCNSMLIKPELITENIKNAIVHLLKRDEFNNLIKQLDKNTGEFKNIGLQKQTLSKHKKLTKNDLKQYKNKNEQVPIQFDTQDYTYSKYLQRILDMKLYDTNKAYHPRIVFKNKNKNAIELFKKLFTESIYKTLAPISKLYYEQEEIINSGIYEEKTSVLFIKCNTNTPYKNNIKHILLEPLYSYIFTETQVEIFIKSIKNTKGFLASLKRISDEAKKYQNGFYKVIEACFNDKKCVDDKEISTIISKDMPNILKNIKEIFNKNKIRSLYIEDNKEITKENLSTFINIFLQTYNILFKEIKGFNKTCKSCTQENSIRSDINNVIAKRLLSDVSKPIDGMLDMMLDRLAYEIIQDINRDDISDIKSLSILLEQNKFNFELDLNDIKRKSNNSIKKIAQNYKDRLNVNICPYDGVEFDKGDYDHILPQSEGVYNSKANMIYASVHGNQKTKGNKTYTLDIIKKEHLKKVFHTDNIENIKTKIKDGLKTIKEDDFTNFDNLSLPQQIAFRYALFMKDTNEYKKAFALLQLDKIKTFSNGTQKRLARLIYEKIVNKYPKEFKTIQVSSKIIDNILVSNTRRILSHNNTALKKQDTQDSHSHCIDAMVVYHLANSSGSHINILESKENKNTKISKRKFKFKFDDVYLEESKINSISKNKRFINAKDVSSYKLFDETIYSEHYHHVNKNTNGLGILIKHHLIYQNHKNKKQYITDIEEINEDNICKIDVFLVSNLLYKLFQNKDKKLLEELIFLDKLRYSTSRKEIEIIFFDKNKTKLLEFNQIKGIPKSSINLYSAVYQKLQNKDKLFKQDNKKTILNENILNELLRDMFKLPTKHKNNLSKKRGKKRHKFTLPILGSPKFRINRNGTWQVLGSNDIATKHYSINNEIKPIPFFTKNTIPLKISDLIDCMLIDKNTQSIYEIDIDIKEVKKYISKLKYFITSKDKLKIIVTLYKKGFNDVILDHFASNGIDCKYKDNKEFQKFVDNYLNIGKDKKDIPKDILLLQNYIGKIRSEKKENSEGEYMNGVSKILNNNKETIQLEYVAFIQQKNKIISNNIENKNV